MARCEDCGKPLKWIKTTAGEWMPCDPASVFFRDSRGGESVEKLVTAQGIVEYGIRMREPDTGCQLGYVPHWASCTKRDQAKGRRWA